MTKGDVFKTEEDRAKCMCQITQELSANIRPTHGFEMPVIYIPEEAQIQGQYAKLNRLPDNQINSLTDLLARKLKIKVQDNLARFRLDLQELKKSIDFLKEE